MKIKYKITPSLEAFLWTGGPDQTEDPPWAHHLKVIDGKLYIPFIDENGNHRDEIVEPCNYILNISDRIFSLSPDDFQKFYEVEQGDETK